MPNESVFLVLACFSELFPCPFLFFFNYLACFGRNVSTEVEFCLLDIESDPVEPFEHDGEIFAHLSHLLDGGLFKDNLPAHRPADDIRCFGHGAPVAGKVDLDPVHPLVFFESERSELADILQRDQLQSGLRKVDPLVKTKKHRV